jgi:hypothetical protein
LIYVQNALSEPNAKLVNKKQINIPESNLPSESKAKDTNCAKGQYNYFGNCYRSCPEPTLADNYSLTCKDISQNPVFIKAYTKSRCINKCGLKFADWSCEDNCKMSGECCSDYKLCDFVQ